MALICSPEVREFADLWCRMDAHEGQAAWVQAIGSIAAIAASALFATVVPLYLRRLEGKEAASRALKNAINAGAIIRACWEALAQLFQSQKITDGTTFIIGAQVGGFRAIMAEIPRHILGPDALLAVGHFETSAAMLDVGVPRALQLQNAPEDGVEIPFADIIAALEKHASVLDTMRPQLISGIWHIDYSDASHKMKA